MANKFKLTIVSPDGNKIEDEANILNVMTTSGALGILAHHLPLVGVIKLSSLSYRKDNDTFNYDISGGILNVKENEVIVLAESFKKIDK